MRISDWSSDVCSSDLVELFAQRHQLLDLQADRLQRRGEFVARGVGGDVLAEPVFAEFHCFGTRSCCSPQKGRAFTSPSPSRVGRDCSLPLYGEGRGGPGFELREPEPHPHPPPPLEGEETCHTTCWRTPTSLFKRCPSSAP